MDTASVVSFQNISVKPDENWKSTALAQVNENQVNFRIMQDITTQWHIHENSDELFLVLQGTVMIDTKGNRHTLQKDDVFVVAAGMEHRARVEGEAHLIVISKPPTA